MAEADTRPELIAAKLNRLVHAIKARASTIGLPLKWFKLKAKGNDWPSITWAQVGRVTEPGRYIFKFGWLTVDIEDELAERRHFRGQPRVLDFQFRLGATCDGHTAMLSQS
jgi:hypothetical protein